MSFINRFQKFIRSKLFIGAFAVTVPLTTLATFFELQRRFPQWFLTEEQILQQDSIQWYTLIEDLPYQGKIGIQETHFWHFYFIPNLNVTAFMRLNQDELLLYNIGPLTDEILSYLKQEKIKHVYHINANNGTIDIFLRDWIQKLGTKRDNFENSDLLPQFTSFDFSFHYQQIFRKNKSLTKEELAHVKQVTSLKSLPPSVSQSFQLYKANMTYFDEIVLYHPLTKTLFGGCLTRYWTDRYKGTPDYNFYRYTFSRKLNKLVTPYKIYYLLDVPEFRRYANQISDLPFKNLMMAQGEFIQNDDKLPQKWRACFNKIIYERYNEGEKV